MRLRNFKTMAEDRTVDHDRDVFLVSDRRVTIADAIVRKVRAHVEQDGLVHRLAGYERSSATWHFNCGVSLLLNAHITEITICDLIRVRCLAAEVEVNTCSLSTPW